MKRDTRVAFSNQGPDLVAVVHTSHEKPALKPGQERNYGLMFVKGLMHDVSEVLGDFLRGGKKYFSGKGLLNTEVEEDHVGGQVRFTLREMAGMPLVLPYNFEQIVGTYQN